MAQLADQHGLLSMEETQNVYALGQLPGVRDQLVALRDQLRINPHDAGAVGQLHRFIIGAVQEFQHLDNADYDALGPTRVPPVHDLKAFDEILRAALAQPDGTPLRIIVEILECLPYDHPKNFHPLRRDVPGDPEPQGTRLVVLAVEAVLGAIAPDLKYWVHDPFAQCRAPPLQAAVERGALGSTRVPAAWIETAQLLSEIFFDLIQHLNIEVTHIMANGDVARRLADMPNLNGALDLFSETLRSAFFGLEAYQLYHPSVLANSAYVELRTALLYRRCIILAWIADKPDRLRDIYDALAALLQLEVDTFDVIAGVARYDATTDPDLHDTFFAVSCFVKGFVRLFGTGKFGRRPQLDETNSGTIACSGYVARRRAWAKKYDRKDEPDLSVEAWLTLFEKEDPSTLRALLVDSGFGEAESLAPEEILPFFRTVKEELVAKVGALDDPPFGSAAPSTTEPHINSNERPRAQPSQARKIHNRQRKAWELSGRQGEPGDWHMTGLERSGRQGAPCYRLLNLATVSGPSGTAGSQAIGLVSEFSPPAFAVPASGKSTPVALNIENLDLYAAGGLIGNLTQLVTAGSLGRARARIAHLYS
ncbi:uncharacterized protein RHOBADRAFT_56434 [Rhodotorula graminis WP1]|uniref:Uncharacterized protein n=1 Tax=Rhodotorula graminis (strain WP1) TaxID=578459 RepID=A0A0P9EJI5_RHOGW|nr:uncharacterized protein RHOBADRAFT_56434 [Rhodotorula graminis WP1]KPV71824.1 hypothetical protein RHOBADRAFT_56434 [Rhodotorula graminis WP1]